MEVLGSLCSAEGINSKEKVLQNLETVTKMCGTDSPTSRVIKPSLPSSSPNEAGEDGNRVIKGLLSSELIINLDHGDPTMFESYWKNVDNERCSFTIDGHESLSYFANNPRNMCWFLEPKLEEEIKRLHDAVGNAKTEGHFIIVGNGSSQLIQAALFALSQPAADTAEPISVVSAAPYYSCYPEVSDFLQSGLYKWAGDARNFDKEGPYIEFVTSPNNPSGVTREPVVNRDQGKIVYDLAYYWPHYTPITTKLDFDVMLFTASKCSGHAGSRIGWALVRDKEVAKRMMKFMEISTIGVSKESQLRTAKVLRVISDSCYQPGLANFFKYSKKLITERWEKLKDIVKNNELFVLQKYPIQYCHFFGVSIKSHPAFAWISCKSDSVDFEKLLRGHKVLVRGGSRFGTTPNYVRVSMLSRDQEFNLFLQRLSAIQEFSTMDLSVI